MADPPSEAGAVHDRLIWVWLAAVALRLVGAPGRLAVLPVVALATFETAPNPLEFLADTR